MKRLVVLLGGLFALGFMWAAPAAAHTTLVASSPADGSRLAKAPQVVTLTFDENVGIGEIGYVHVTDQEGTRVDAGDAYHPGGGGKIVADPLRGGLRDGTYTASYRVISADAHPVTGSIAFVVGDGPLVRAGSPASAAVDPVTGDAFDVARWISYAGLVLLGGLWLVGTVWPAGRGDPRTRRIVLTSWFALAGGTALETLLQGPYSAGAGLDKLFSESLLRDTLKTDYGELHIWRLFLVGALALVLVQVLQPHPGRRWVDALAALLGGGVLWTFSDSGHAATTSPTWLSIPVDMAHLLAAATWLGGLLMLVAAVLPRRAPDELATVLPVFSRVAFTSVVVLVGTGTYSAWRGIGTVHAIFSTTYGLLVVGKVALLIGILLVANLSRRLVRTRVVAYAMTETVTVEPEPPVDDDVRVERLRRAVAVEAVVGLVVLGFTAVLVAEPRGKEALLADYRDPISTSAPLANGESLRVVASSGVHGPITFTVMLPSHHAHARITATATQHDEQIGPLPIKFVEDAAGGYDGTATLPVAGTWELDFVVHTSQFEATATDTTIRLH